MVCTCKKLAQLHNKQSFQVYMSLTMLLQIREAHRNLRIRIPV